MKKDKIDVEELLIKACIESSLNMINPNNKFDVDVEISEDGKDVNIIIDGDE